MGNSGWFWVPHDTRNQIADFVRRWSDKTETGAGQLELSTSGKIERWHKSLKGACIRPGTTLSLEDARRLVQGYVEHCNNVRLNSVIGYITPKDMLAERLAEIHSQRDRKLEAAPASHSA